MSTMTQAVFLLYCILSVNLLILIFPSIALGCTTCVHQTKLAYYAYSGAVNGIDYCIQSAKIICIFQWHRIFHGVITFVWYYWYSWRLWIRIICIKLLWRECGSCRFWSLQEWRCVWRMLSGKSYKYGIVLIALQGFIHFLLLVLDISGSYSRF